MGPMSLPVLSPQVFIILSALIEERLGLHYGPTHRELFEHKVTVRAADAGFDSLLDYYYFLRYDPAADEEFDALIDALVVGETYFFREFEPLMVTVRDLASKAARIDHRIRIWSAACSTGEEPYSIAMLLAEHHILDRVELIASDVSARALERARACDFGPRAIRDHAPIPDFARRWLSIEDNRFVLHDRIRQAVDFRRINLLDDQAIRSLGCFDLILCRNVLIYLDDNTARRVVDSLAHALADRGTLLVGVSESLLRLGTALACEERGGVFVYRKVV